MAAGKAKPEADKLFNMLKTSTEFQPERSTDDYKHRNPGSIYYADDSQKAAVDRLQGALAPKSKPMTRAKYTDALRKKYANSPAAAGEKRPLIVFPREK